jgi:hypothetical protein
MKQKHILAFAANLLFLIPNGNAGVTLFPSIPNRATSDQYICKVGDGSSGTHTKAHVIRIKSLEKPSESTSNGSFRKLP